MNQYKDALEWWDSLSIYEQKVYAKRSPFYFLFWDIGLRWYPSWIQAMYDKLDADVIEFYRKRALIVDRSIKEYQESVYEKLLTV